MKNNNGPSRNSKESSLKIDVELGRRSREQVYEPVAGNKCSRNQMLQVGVKKVMSLASNKCGREQVRPIPNVAKNTGNKD
jgi:hypothetical protein